MAELTYWDEDRSYTSEDIAVLRVDQITVSTVGITAGMCPLTVGPFGITAGMCPITVSALGLSTTAVGVYRGLLSVDQAIAALNTAGADRVFAIGQRDKVREVII